MESTQKSCDDLQQERDELILRQEALSEHFQKNSISIPRELTESQKPQTQKDSSTTSSKAKNQSLLDEYRGKLTKL